jgi:hypothetical protein
MVLSALVCQRNEIQRMIRGEGNQVERRVRESAIRIITSLSPYRYSQLSGTSTVHCQNKHGRRASAMRQK